MRRYVSRNSLDNQVTYIGQKGEITVDPITGEVRVHDGVTPGGTQIAGSGGLTGPTGNAGAVGDAGPTGPTGAPGEASSTGATGPTGETGPIGLIGPTGAPGEAANTGATGPTGDVGPVGPMGLIGYRYNTNPPSSQDTDPGFGFCKQDVVTDPTILYISNFDLDGHSIIEWLAAINLNTNDIKGTVALNYLYSGDITTSCAFFEIIGQITVNSLYSAIPVQAIGTDWSPNDIPAPTAVTFSLSGSIGPTGITGPTGPIFYSQQQPMTAMSTTFTATAGQTTYQGIIQSARVDVYIDGSKLPDFRYWLYDDIISFSTPFVGGEYVELIQWFVYNVAESLDYLTINIRGNINAVTSNVIVINNMVNASNDIDAATGGVQLNQLYHDNGIVRIRLT